MFKPLNMAKFYLQDLTTEELTFIVGQAVTSALERGDNKSPKEELLTREQAADLLDIDLSTLHAWVNKSKLKSYAIGSRRYFKRSEIFESLVELKAKRS